MAQDRSADIAKINRDINRLARAAETLGKMAMNNMTLTDDLDTLNVDYSFSVKIPQPDFGAKMKALNEHIEPSIRSINDKIVQVLEELQELLAQYEEEQAAWEAEQEG
ncbi:hypothetical protein SAMN02910275_01477 [Butyrivibrio sp. INlla18]|uniref:hypothetical protein n=1 Tax=Butyrivibrio sp. INlla18 TaxID=1520806 RepID=UPI000890C837|nr:hypothetical protein [Butyrivibrio sp. INlla18]SDA60198.1 hypothetical protein SAMN02910275_01477 [Butyrivibrio sp. INlla18]